MTIAYRGIDILKRVLCLLLIFVLLLCFFMCPRAGAVALEAATVAYGGLLIGTILVGAGVIFRSHGDMVKVGNAMAKSFIDGSNAIWSKISAISSWAVEHGEAAAKGALRVGKDLYQDIIDAFNASYSDGTFSIVGGAVTLSDGADESSCVAAADAIKDLLSSKQDCTLYFDYYSEYGSHYEQYQTFSYTDTGLKVKVVDSDGKIVSNSTYPYSNYDLAYWEISKSACGLAYGHSIATFVFKNGTGGGWSWTLRAPFSVSFSDSVAIPQPDLKYPSDDYLVKMPDLPAVDEVTGEITYPSDAAYTKDAVAVPYPVDTEGVKVPDIPYDVPLDQSTGKALDNTGTDTDTPSKPGEGTDTPSTDTKVDWPSSDKLSLPERIATKFPFCIPFDVARLIGLLEAEPKAPVFRMPLIYGDVMHEEIVLDLDNFSNVIRIIRWGETMLFVAALAAATRNYIKW